MVTYTVCLRHDRIPFVFTVRPIPVLAYVMFPSNPSWLSKELGYFRYLSLSVRSIQNFLIRDITHGEKN